MTFRSFTFTADDGVPPAVAPFAHATASGQTLYVTGQMPTAIHSAAFINSRAFPAPGCG